MTNATENVRTLIHAIAEALVDNPKRVISTITSNGNVHTINLDVAESDAGKIIGKNGRTARSIRTILSGIARDQHMNLNIMTDGGI